MLESVSWYANISMFNPQLPTEIVGEREFYMTKKSKTPYLRDVFLAYLVEDARRTEPDGFPIIEEWMVATEPPKEMIQWDRRRDVTDPERTGMCFYCSDPAFQPILGNPKAYTEKLRRYGLIVGLDPSPYDNMPLVVQKSQIYLNLATTFYYGKQGIKVIPNVRLGSAATLSCLDAYPRHALIAIGTHGFTHRKDNRAVFIEQIKAVVDKLEPSGICVYGPASDELFGYAKSKGIPIHQYDSYTMKENAKDKARRLSEGKTDEGQ